MEELGICRLSDSPYSSSTQERPKSKVVNPVLDDGTIISIAWASFSMEGRRRLHPSGPGFWYKPQAIRETL